MNRLNAYFIITMLAMSILSASIVTSTQSIAAGVTEKTKYSWEVAESNFDITALVKPEAEPPSGALNYTDDLLNQLVNSKIHIAVGEIYDETGVMYIVPILVTSNDLTFSKEFLMALGLNESAAEALEFTIPKGSAIINLANALIPIDESMPSLPILLKGFVEDETDPFGVLNLLPTESLISAQVSMPYYYGKATPPAPILSPSNIPSYGEDWVGGEYPNGITANYEVDGDNAIFTLSGSNTTEEIGENYYFYLEVAINEFKMTYSLSTGLLKELSIDLNYVYNNTYEYWGEPRMNYVSFSGKFKISFVGESGIEIGLVEGEKLGFKVTKFYLSDDLVNFLNETIFDGQLNETTITQVRAFMDNLRWTYTYSTTNPYYPSGLELFYEILVENPLVGMENTTYGMFNIYALGSPYITPDWEIQYGSFQYQQHVYLKVLPKFLKYLIENNNENAFFNYESNYGIFESPDGNWVSLISNLSITMGYKNTVQAEEEYKSNVTLDFDSWMTYSKDGRLTEFGITISFEGRVDENGNNDLGDETLYSGTFKLTVNRVENEGGPTTEPDFENPIDPPEPKGNWKEVTPYKVLSEQGGFLPESIMGVPTPIFLGGIAALIIIAIIASILRRR